MRVMIDIETLATRSDAAIVQIGAVAFENGAILGEPLLVSIAPEFYEQNREFHVSDQTKAWWAKQSKAARDSLNINKVATVYIALDRMREWFEEIGFNPKKDEVWANGPQFDLSILRYAASKAYGDDNQVPWHYRQERDCRTLTALAGWVDAEELGDAGLGLVGHRADHDAIKQALRVSVQLDRIKT